MILMETHDAVAREDVGAFVQQYLQEGAILIVVTNNPDGVTCTVSIQKD
jgi:hypothetical protein